MARRWVVESAALVEGASRGRERVVEGARYERLCCSRPLRLDPVFVSVGVVVGGGRESSESVVVVVFRPVDEAHCHVPRSPP